MVPKTGKARWNEMVPMRDSNLAIRLGDCLGIVMDEHLIVALVQTMEGRLVALRVERTM